MAGRSKPGRRTSRASRTSRAPRTPQKRIFVTGGASGLGQALAERYARDGWQVAIGDLQAERGAEVAAAIQGAGGPAAFLRCDVTKEKDLAAAARWLEAEWGGVDVVVNNAGVAVSGGIADTPLADWQWILDVNVLGVVRGCRVFTPLFRRQGGGQFVNVASMAGLVHPPMMSAYSATKAAVVALSESLRLELAPDRIGVTVACPGFFRTNLAETARTSSGMGGLTRALVNRARRSAPEVAEDIFRGACRGDFLVLTHVEGEIAWMLKRVLPFPLYEQIMDRSSRKMMGRRPERRAEPRAAAVPRGDRRDG